MKIDISHKSNLHVTQTKKTYRCFWLILFSGAIIALCLYLAYQKQIWGFTKDFHAAQVAQLEQQNQSLLVVQKELSQLKQHILSLEHESTIQLASNKALSHKLLLVEDKLAIAQKKQLLYKDILSADGLKKGLVIQYFNIRKHQYDETERRYEYTLVLSHLAVGDTVVKGRYNIVIVGELAGKEKRYSHQDISTNGGVATNHFSLKYYQSLEGDILLPAGFIPKKIELSIVPTSKKYAGKKKNYKWLPLLNSGI